MREDIPQASGSNRSKKSRPTESEVPYRRAARWEVMRTARIRGMSRQRKPKHPGGRPAVFGPRQNLVAVRVDDRMYDELETHAEAAGLPLALYCMLRGTRVAVLESRGQQNSDDRGDVSTTVPLILILSACLR